MFSRKFIIRAIAVVGLYVAAASYIFKNEERFFFNHDKISNTESYKFSVSYEELNIKINEEINLHALFYSQKSAKGIILAFPSSSYQSLEYDINDNIFYKLGYSVIIPEYRGSGKSTSVFHTEDDIFSDAQQWYKMTSRLADSLPLIVYGQGFGCGTAAWLGGSQSVDLVILDTPFYSWNKIMLKKYFWWLPHSYFTQYKIPLWEFLRKSVNKTILVHATTASKIKYDNSLQLLQYLKPGDELITLDSETKEGNRKQYKKHIKSILDNTFQAK